MMKKLVYADTSLSKRYWVFLNDSSNAEYILDSIKESIGDCLKCAAVYVQIVLEQGSRKVVLRTLINMLHEIKVGYEKTYPLVSVFIPMKMATQNHLSTIAECDIYRPGIKIYPIFSDVDLKGKDIASLREHASEILEVFKRCKQVYMECDVILLVEKQIENLQCMIKLCNYAYTYDTAEDLKMPLLQVSPTLTFVKDTATLLRSFIACHDRIQNIYNIMCGATTMVLRYDENKKINTGVIVLNGCGAGCFEHAIKASGLSYCFYAEEFDKSEIWQKECESCDVASNCTGCKLLTGEGNCRIKNFLIECE